MASIDKIYGSKEQYWEFRNWCDRHAPELIFHFYYTPDDLELITSGEFVLVNLPTWVDMWLYVHCSIGFIRDRIADQYDLNPITNIIRIARRDVRRIKKVDCKRNGKGYRFTPWFAEWRKENYPLTMKGLL
jgi:hypothetical protein